MPSGCSVQPLARGALWKHGMGHRASVIWLCCKWQPGQSPKQLALLATEKGGVDLISGVREPLQLEWGKRFSTRGWLAARVESWAPPPGGVYRQPPGHTGPLLWSGSQVIRAAVFAQVAMMGNGAAMGWAQFGAPDRPSGSGQDCLAVVAVTLRKRRMVRTTAHHGGTGLGFPPSSSLL